MIAEVMVYPPCSGAASRPGGERIVIARAKARQGITAAKTAFGKHGGGHFRQMRSADLRHGYAKV
jgi:hypothetical protein